jgi:hypothetical protein
MFLQTIGPETEGIRRRIYEVEYFVRKSECISTRLRIAFQAVFFCNH